ncbi:MAG: hypothetical protein HQK54_12710 [Oligoflexales bacterium]|nr:hypothetical protein [Oligoflexales bacterium]
MKIFFITFAILFLLGCGSSEEDEKKRLNKNTITLDPPAGTYNYKPWVKFTKKDDGVGSGGVYAKAPSKTSFEDAICLSKSPYNSSVSYCVEITQSGTLTYRLETTSGKSDEKTAEYTITSFAVNDVKIGSKSTLNAIPEAITLSEQETFCSFSSDGTALDIIIQTKNDAKLGSNRYAYVALKLKNPSSNATTKVTAENEFISGIIIKQRSDDPPSIFYSATYSTSIVLKDDNGKALSSPSCTITAENAEPGKLSKGSFTCTSLGTFEVGDNRLLGEYIDISGNWQCDSYKK